MERYKESGSVADMYRDRWISCDDNGITVRWYYLWGTKRIPYRSIRSLKRVQQTPIRGKARMWGTANPRYWASLDPKRSTKPTGFVVDVGRFVHPFLTPDDPDKFEHAVRGGAHLGIGPEQPARGPIV